MLQQTTVAAVIPFYERWMARFPTIDALAKADDEEVLAHWQGLGYYRRCRSLLAGARQALSLGIPSSAEEWLALPGIGPYTAGAIASISQGEPAALVDGNVERVFARLTGFDRGGAELNRAAWQWARANISAEAPGDWNQALMELGATICTPRQPSCDRCPVASFCVAKREGRQEELPVPKVRPEFVRRHHLVWVPVCEQKYGVRRTPAGEWWEGLWSFPWVQEPDKNRLEELFPTGWPENAGWFKHTVTNHKIKADVSLLRCGEELPGLSWHTYEGLKSLAMPAPQRRALKLVRKIQGLSTD